ncbi:hypothetical protein ACFL35_22095, partial [Candidatus Riflebacteria bacterium]
VDDRKMQRFFISNLESFKELFTKENDRSLEEKYLLNANNFQKDVNYMLGNMKFAFYGRVFLPNIYRLFEENPGIFDVLKKYGNKINWKESAEASIPYKTWQLRGLEDFFSIQYVLKKSKNLSESREKNWFFANGVFFFQPGTFRKALPIDEIEFQRIKHKFIGSFPLFQNRTRQYLFFLHDLLQVPGIQTIDIDNFLEKFSYVEFKKSIAFFNRE